MDQQDQRDTAEEAANQEALAAEQAAELPTSLPRRKLYVNDDGQIRCNEPDHQCEGDISWPARRMDLGEIVATLVEHFEPDTKLPEGMWKSAGYTADEMAIINKYDPPAKQDPLAFPLSGEPATRLRTYEEVLADSNTCDNCRGTLARCNASGCGGRQQPGHRGWPVAESAGRAAIEFAADKLGIPLPEGQELVEKLVEDFPPKHMKICPGCEATFDMMAPGQMVMGTDDDGLYLEHVPCGHRGRQVLS